MSQLIQSQSPISSKYIFLMAVLPMVFPAISLIGNMTAKGVSFDEN